MDGDGNAVIVGGGDVSTGVWIADDVLLVQRLTPTPVMSNIIARTTNNRFISRFTKVNALVYYLNDFRIIFLEAT
jgi:hypothetical protein